MAPARENQRLDWRGRDVAEGVELTIDLMGRRQISAAA